MKFYTKMPKVLYPFYNAEIQSYKNQFIKNNYLQSWVHLEKAHIIAQVYPFKHSQVHWFMLLFGIKTKNIKEIVGQIPRLIFGGVKSFVGKIPIGNTGGANVNALAVMPIPMDLQEILNKAKG